MKKYCVECKKKYGHVYNDYSEYDIDGNIRCAECKSKTHEKLNKHLDSVCMICSDSSFSVECEICKISAKCDVCLKKDVPLLSFLDYESESSTGFSLCKECIDKGFETFNRVIKK